MFEFFQFYGLLVLPSGYDHIVKVYLDTYRVSILKSGMEDMMSVDAMNVNSVPDAKC